MLRAGGAAVANGRPGADRRLCETTLPRSR